MKFGPKFKKMFVAYPSIDKTKINANRLSKLDRKSMYEILKGMKKDGARVPFDQPTRTSSDRILGFIYDVMNRLS